MKVINPINRLLLCSGFAFTTLFVSQVTLGAEVQPSDEASVSDVLDAQERYQDAGVKSQQRIDELDDETVGERLGRWTI